MLVCRARRYIVPSGRVSDDGPCVLTRDWSGRRSRAAQCVFSKVTGLELLVPRFVIEFFSPWNAAVSSSTSRASQCVFFFCAILTHQSRKMKLFDLLTVHSRRKSRRCIIFGYWFISSACSLFNGFSSHEPEMLMCEPAASSFLLRYRKKKKKFQVFTWC